MQKRPIVSLFVLGTALLALSGCAMRLSPAEQKGFDDAGLVMRYFPRAADGTFTFDFGPYQGGTATIGPNDMAFWVKDGIAYTVNQTARGAAPQLAQAPNTVTYDLMFKASARGGYDE